MNNSLRKFILLIICIIIAWVVFLIIKSQFTHTTSDNLPDELLVSNSPANVNSTEKILTASPTPINNQTNKKDNGNQNINVMIKRIEGWKKVVTVPVVNEKFMKHIDGSTATVPITAELYRQFFNKSDSKINELVYHSTTHNAYLNLINKKGIDIIFVTEPSNEEMKIAKKKGLRLEVAPITREGFVFIVNEENPVNNLTVKQIQDIYSGKISSWEKLGGKKQDILAFQREKNSGSQTAMEQMVMKNKPMLDRLTVNAEEAMGPLVSAIADCDENPGAIGYSYYYYLNNLFKHKNIKVLNVNGVSPDNKNLINKKYPFTTSYYAVIRSTEPTNSPARKLFKWLQTDDGQKLVEMCGYCTIR